MSNGNGGNNCGEFVRNGNFIYVLDTKDIYDSKDGKAKSKLGPLAIIHIDEFAKRADALAMQFLKGDTTNISPMLNEEQAETMNAGERYAMGRYAVAGLLNPYTIPDRGSVVAQENLGAMFPGEVNPHLTPNRYAGQLAVAAA